MIPGDNKMERQYLTVTALNRYLKFKFDNDTNLQDVLLKAEISNFKRHSRGHLYFTLKDEQSQISAVMFLSNASKLLFLPKEGSKVIVEGYVSIYETAGSYQVYVTKMSEAGIGDLYQAYEMLKAKLEKEGLFLEEHKSSLPRFPKTIGVITSPTGAAVRDIIHIINRRYPLARIIIYPALVQGVEAKQSITEQIRKANNDKLVDVLIVGRGGGSIEDLWAFNEEIVARAIYDSCIPVVSGVGHETDFTIADFVADRRAPTPSGAAEIVVPDQKELLQDISDLRYRLTALSKRMFLKKQDELKKIVSSTVLIKPKRLLENYELRFSALYERLQQQKPDRLLSGLNDKVCAFERTLRLQTDNIYKTKLYRMVALIEKLELVNPLSIMKKGFAIVKKDNRLVRSINDVLIDDQLNLVVTDGSLDCKVLNIRKDES